MDRKFALRLVPVGAIRGFHPPDIPPVGLVGTLRVPSQAQAVVAFVHGSGSSRLSPRNMAVAEALNTFGFATLLFDLLTPKEEADRANVFDIALLAERLSDAVKRAVDYFPAQNWSAGSLGLNRPATTAIVHPRKFTTGIMRAAVTLGTALRHGRVTGLVRGGSGSAVQGVEVDGEILEADAVVIGMGPWSLIAAGWLPLPAVFGHKSPSLVYDTGTDIPADALFLDYRDDSGATVTVEVFPRAGGNTLVTAFSDDGPLPLDPAAVAPDPSAIARIEAICERPSPAFTAERIIARQACFRPVTQDGLPLIGRVPPGCAGAYVATGHSVWDPQRAGDRRGPWPSSSSTGLRAAPSSARSTRRGYPRSTRRCCVPGEVCLIAARLDPNECLWHQIRARVSRSRRGPLARPHLVPCCDERFSSVSTGQPSA